MSKENEIAIKVDNVSKNFLLPHQRASTLKSVFINPLRRSDVEKQKALDKVSFEVKKGEFFGIVGRNGSGKSTLLKCMAGVYATDEGNIHINGKLVPFIELGVGFNPELSGRDNVYLNGALLGFNRQQMDAMYEEIVEFAELEKFMDQKLKNYSSGMQVRLAFSIAIKAEGDILLLDEVLAVGDSAFQKKCNDYFYKLKEQKATVVLVTHSMEAVERFCDRAIMIDQGQIVKTGKPTEVANRYILDNLNPNTSKEQKKLNKNLSEPVIALDVKSVSKVSLKEDENLEFEIIYELSDELEIDLGISIVHKNLSIIEQNTKEEKLPSSKNIKHTVKYSINLEGLRPNSYRVDVAIFRKSDFNLVGFNTDAFSFNLRSDQRGGGVVITQGRWSVER